MQALDGGNRHRPGHQLSEEWFDSTQSQPPPIRNLDAIGFPAFRKIDLARYQGYGMMTKPRLSLSLHLLFRRTGLELRKLFPQPGEHCRGNGAAPSRSGSNLFLFQDEFFVSGKQQVLAFCRALERAGLEVEWKAFGRVNLTDEEMMRAMAKAGCLELRFGIESGSDRVS